MALERKPQLKKNVGGAYIGGVFRPFRSSEDYDPFLAGDFDFTREQREERKEKNRKKEIARFEKRVEKELENELRDAASTRQSLSQFVKASGGLRFDEKTTHTAIKGELRRLSFKQSGKRGIAHAKGKHTPDRLRELADEAGFPGMNSEHDFLSALEKDLTGKRKIYATAEGNSNYKRNPDLQAQLEGLLKIGFKHQPILKIGKEYEANLKIAAQKGLCEIRRENGKLLAVKLKNNPRRRSGAQTALDFTGGRELPSFVIGEDKLKLPKYASLQYFKTEDGERYYRDPNTGYSYVVRRNPKKGNMISATKQKQAAKLLSKSLLKNSDKTLDVLKKLSAIPAKKNPASKAKPKSNGIVSRYLGRRRAKKEYGKQLKYAARIERSKARQADGERRARQNPVKQNPAKVVSMAGKYRIKLGDGSFLKLMNQIWETRSKARAQEIAAKTRNASDDEIKWLNSLRPGVKRNPFTSSTFFNIAGGLASALHVKKLLLEDSKPARRTIPAKKPKANPAVKAGDYVLDKYDNRRKKVHSVQDDLIFIGKDHEPVTINEIQLIPQKTSESEMDKLNKQSTKLAKQSVLRAQRAYNRGLITKQSFDKTIALTKTLIGEVRKKNPAKIPVRKTFEMFQGRPATSAKVLPVSSHAPARLDQLGDLIEIQLTDGRRYNFAQRKNNPFRLCANTQGKRLWIAGGKLAKQNPKLAAHQLEVMGEIDHVVYSTHKPHHGDYDTTHYIHALGEVTGERPLLALDREGFPVIHGGAYTIEDRGIVN